MKKTFLGIVLFIILLAGISHANDSASGPTLIAPMFADQGMYVGYCGVSSTMPNLDPREVCINCNLVQSDALVVNGIVCGEDINVCGEEIKWDTGVETASGVYTVTKNRKGNPIPGRFEYKGSFMSLNGIDDNDGCKMYFGDCVPASDACVSGNSGPIVAAIHGDVILSYNDEEIPKGTWVAECMEFDPGGECLRWGTDFPGANWATYVHVPCDTGELGICRDGLLSCNSSEVVCDGVQESQPEICDDGLDNDCDGLVDGEDTEDCGVLCPCYDNAVLTTAQEAVEVYFENNPSAVPSCSDIEEGLLTRAWLYDLEGTAQGFNISIGAYFCLNENICSVENSCLISYADYSYYEVNINPEEIDECIRIIKEHEIWQLCTD